MASERIEVGVSYDLRRGYYITTTTNVPPTAALSLAGLRKQGPRIGASFHFLAGRRLDDQRPREHRH